MKQDLERLNRVAGEISAKSDEIPSQITSLNAKLKELDSESEHQYDELLKHDQLLNKLMPGSGGPTVQSNSPVPPAPPAPTAQPPVPSAPQLSAQSPERIAADAIARAQKRKNDIRQYAGQPEEFTAESRFNNLIKWATGKKP
jgi:TolA-binding protein